VSQRLTFRSTRATSNIDREYRDTTTEGVLLQLHREIMESTTCHGTRSRSFGSRRSGMTMSKSYKNPRPLFSSSSPSRSGALPSCAGLPQSRCPCAGFPESRCHSFGRAAFPQSWCPRGVALSSSEAYTAQATARHSEKPESESDKGERAQADHPLVHHFFHRDRPPMDPVKASLTRLLNCVPQPIL
jgi:hypothetical protein